MIPDDRRYLIADFHEPRALHYDREGRLIQRYGRRGNPGEMDGGCALPWGDEVLVFSFQSFRRDDGQFVER